MAMLAGCSNDGPSQPPVVTTPDLFLHTADGDKAVAARVPAGQGVIRFADIHTGFQGAEPNIGVTPSGAIFATAYETVLRSLDEGRSWQDVYKQRVGFTNDPMLWVDEETGRIFSPQQFPEGSCSSQVFSDDDGDTWLEKPLTCGIPLVDHQKLASGPIAGPLGTVAPVAVYPRLVSYCYNKPDVGTYCAVSLDGGVTFSLDQLVDPASGSPVPPVSGTPSACGGLNGHQRHGPEGEILLPYGYECRRTRLARSTDGGLTWERLDLGERNLELDPEVAATTDGTWYYLYRGSDERPYLLRSHDLFDTIEGPFAVAPAEIKGTMFLGLVAGADGRIAGPGQRSPQHRVAALRWFQRGRRGRRAYVPHRTRHATRRPRAAGHHLHGQALPPGPGRRDLEPQPPGLPRHGGLPGRPHLRLLLRRVHDRGLPRGGRLAPHQPGRRVGHRVAAGRPQPHEEDASPGPGPVVPKPMRACAARPPR
jgi:hypothetical protein